jgi:hypothetical protein
MRSLRPTGRCRVGDRARPTNRTKDSPKRTSAGLLESDLAWAPTHTLINPFTEVVDHSAANSILAARMVRQFGAHGWRSHAVVWLTPTV